MNLDGSKKETIIAKIQGRKGNNKVEIVRNGDCGTDVGSTTNKSQILGGENKKDDSDEDFSSTESSNCTYKSINIGHFFVQSELVDLLQCSLSRKGKNDDFFPVFSFSIPYEKARDFRKRGGQYLRESQYRDLVVDVYL